MASHISPSKMETKASSSTAQDFIDYGDVCRICGSDENSLNLIGIYSNEGLGDDLPTKINTYLPVTVASTDDLPLQCCTKCVSTLNSWHVFVNNSVEADSKWKNFHVLASSSNKLLNEEEGDDGIGDRDDDQSELDDDMPLSELVETKQEPEDDDDPYNETAAEEPTSIAFEQVQIKVEVEDLEIDIKEELPSSDEETLSRESETTEIAQNYEPKSTVDLKTKSRPKLECPVCQRKLSSDFTLRQHLRLHSDTMPYQCQKCARRFKTPNALYTHQLHYHDTSIKYPCKICDIVCISKANYDTHMIHHLQGNITCIICKKDFKTKVSLKNHRKLHSFKEFPCELCGEVVKGTSLREHNITHHSDTQFKCSICLKIFNKRNSYAKHMKIHKAVGKAFECEVCLKKFSLKRYLNTHMSAAHKKKDMPSTSKD